MSKFFITNKIELFQILKKNVEQSPFATGFSFDYDGIYAVTTKKLTLENINGWHNSEEFCIATGTLVWKDGIAVNSEVLTDIHKTYNDDVNDIRNQSYGNYAVSVYKGNKLTVFGEVTGFYDIFYYWNGDSYLISNSLYDMFLVLKDKLTINRMSFIEQFAHNGIISGDTFFKEIRRLNGYDYIRVSHGNFECITENHPYPRWGKSYEEAVSSFKENAVQYAKKMYSAFGRPTISITGGLDARMVLASFLSSDIKPDLYYGTGDSFITNTKKKDKEISRLYASKFNLKLYEESRRTPTPLDKYWDKYLNLFGFYYYIYGSSDDMMSSIINNPNHYFTFGFGGELLRPLDWIETRKDANFTLDEYIQYYYINEITRNDVIPLDDYISYIRDKLIKVCNHYALNPEKIAKEDAFLLDIERRKTADSHMLNLVNLMKFCSYHNSQYNILLSSRISVRDSAYSKFMLRSIDAMFPALLEVPVFSHCVTRLYDSEKIALVPQKLSINSRIKRFLRKRAYTFYNLLRKRKNIRINDKIHYIRTYELFHKYDSLNVIKCSKETVTLKHLYYIMRLYALSVDNKSKK